MASLRSDSQTTLKADSRDLEGRPSSRWSEVSTVLSEGAVDLKDPGDRKGSLQQDATSNEPYHVFPKSKKKWLVALASFAGMFSPLSSNIYFPALDSIAKELGVPNAHVVWSITTFMVIQGIAPSIWGPISDVVGRRGVFIGTFLVYLISNIALAEVKNLPALLVLRGVQAIGSASTISVAMGVVGDIATPQERGGFTATSTGVRSFGQAFGPVLGGFLAAYLGWRSLFWFLFALGSLTILSIVIFLPETFRPVAENGSVQLEGTYKPIIYYFTGQPYVTKGPIRDGPKRTLTFASFYRPLKVLAETDMFVTMLYGAISYTVWSMVTSATSDLFATRYHLTEQFVGLVFMANGAGCVFGSQLAGPLMDRDFRIVEAEYRKAHNISPSEDISTTKARTSADFPLEQARFRSIWFATIIFAASVAGFGFGFETHMAVPIILLFVIAFSQQVVFNVVSTLTVDLYPTSSASATATNNLVRCTIGAGGTSAIIPMIEKLGMQWAFGFLAILALMAIPLLVIEWRYGQGWRARRMAKKEKAARENEEADRVSNIVSEKYSGSDYSLGLPLSPSHSKRMAGMYRYRVGAFSSASWSTLMNPFETEPPLPAKPLPPLPSRQQTPRGFI